MCRASAASAASGVTLAEVGHYQSADTFCACLFNQSGSNQRFSPSGRFGRFGAEFPESVCGQLLFIGGIQLIERPGALSA